MTCPIEHDKPGDDIVVVSGLPRSGTSMMMAMLSAGGLDLLVDESRPPDASNPGGYYEFSPVKKLADDASWLPGARGRAIKIVSPLLCHLPGDYTYKVIFMLRDLGEILLSQRKMLESNEGRRSGMDVDERLPGAYARHLETVTEALKRAPNISLLDVAHADAIAHPKDTARRVDDFLELKLDTEAMAAAVDRQLYRSRGGD